MSAITSSRPLSTELPHRARLARLNLHWPEQGAAFGLIIVLGLAAFEIFNSVAWSHASSFIATVSMILRLLKSRLRSSTHTQATT